MTLKILHPGHSLTYVTQMENLFLKFARIVLDYEFELQYFALIILMACMLSLMELGPMEAVFPWKMLKKLARRKSRVLGICRVLFELSLHSAFELRIFEIAPMRHTWSE